MYKKVVLLLLVFFLVGCGNVEVEEMKLSSSAFEDNGNIPSKHTCDGEDISPQLSIEEIPEGAKSLVLIMDDPDAVKPAGKVWDHWIIFNIPPETKEVSEGQEPQGTHGIGTSGNKKYHGPCPPDGEHSYFFKLYALDVELSLEEGATKPEIEKAMEWHILEQTELIGKYKRK
tara:strand:+ start:383 stop:901 length:519 start_codon:yes stop_codon:yes gene_type:complete